MAERLAHRSAPSVHVRSRGDGVWLVVLDGADRPLSEHPDASRATRAAAAHAATRGGHVILHDRYHRTRVLGRRG